MEARTDLGQDGVGGSLECVDNGQDVRVVRALVDDGGADDEQPEGEEEKGEGGDARELHLVGRVGDKGWVVRRMKTC